MECSETISACCCDAAVKDGIFDAARAVRESGGLVHCITNYVTVESCANAVLAVGGSPIMSDEPDDVRDITAICPALVLNIGTLNKATIEGMRTAGSVAAELGSIPWELGLRRCALPLHVSCSTRFPLVSSGET